MGKVPRPHYRTSVKSVKLLSVQISSEFCNWLKELPHGNDDTVNNTNPGTKKLRAGDDTT